MERGTQFSQPFPQECFLLRLSSLQTGGTRHGGLSLRQQRMSQIMLELLRTETARVHMSLVQRDSDDLEAEAQPVLHENGKWMPDPNTFVYLRTLITNLSRTLDHLRHISLSH